MTEWRAPNKDSDTIIIPDILVCTIQKSAPPRKLFFFFFMAVFGYLGQIRGTPKSRNHIFSFYLRNVFLDFQLNLISSTFQEGQFESHLLDSCFCLFQNWTWKYCLLYKRQFLLKDTFRIILQRNLCLLLNENGQLFPFSSKLPANLQPKAVPSRHNQSWEGARWLPLLFDDFCFAFPLIAKFCIQLGNLWNPFGNRQNISPW